MDSTDERQRAIRRRVKQARIDAGYTHAEVGDRLGMTETGYGHYERGRQSFTVEQLFQLATLFHRPVEWFLGLDAGVTENEGRALALYRQAEEHGLGEVALRMLGAITKGETTRGL